MKLTIWNLKGGMGKTFIALILALLHKLCVVTNDTYSPIDKILPKGKTYNLQEWEVIPSTPDNINLIYDFWGYADKRLIDCAKKSDWVLIPIIYKSPLDMQVTLNAIAEIKPYNSNILIIANATEGNDFERIKKEIKKHYDVPIMEIKKSKAFVRCINEKKSLIELMKENKLFSFHFKKPHQQIDTIWKFITK